MKAFLLLVVEGRRLVVIFQIGMFFEQIVVVELNGVRHRGSRGFFTFEERIIYRVIRNFRRNKGERHLGVVVGLGGLGLAFWRLNDKFKALLAGLQKVRLCGEEGGH